MTTISFPPKGRAGVMRLTNGITTNYGSIKVEGGYFYYYTGKGLFDIFRPGQSEEEKKAAAPLLKLVSEENFDALMTTGHVAKIKVEEVFAFLS